MGFSQNGIPGSAEPNKNNSNASAGPKRMIADEFAYVQQ